MDFEAWMDKCDRVAGLRSEGLLTDDLVGYDWYASWEWGDSPDSAVAAAITLQTGVHSE